MSFESGVGPIFPKIDVLVLPAKRDAARVVGKVAKWWLPERWAFITEIPKTSVGKFDKKVLRARHAAGEIEVVSL